MAVAAMVAGPVRVDDSFVLGGPVAGQLSAESFGFRRDDGKSVL